MKEPNTSRGYSDQQQITNQIRSNKQDYQQIQQTSQLTNYPLENNAKSLYAKNNHKNEVNQPDLKIKQGQGKNLQKVVIDQDSYRDKYFSQNLSNDHQGILIEEASIDFVPGQNDIQTFRGTFQDEIEDTDSRKTETNATKQNVENLIYNSKQPNTNTKEQLNSLEFHNKYGGSNQNTAKNLKKDWDDDIDGPSSSSLSDHSAIILKQNSQEVKPQNKGLSMFSNLNTARINPLAQRIGDLLLVKMIDISEYLVTFHLGRFIRIFIYHYFYFYLGVMIVPIIRLFDSMSLANNMQFWFKTAAKSGFILQNIQSVFASIMVILWTNYFYEYLPFKTELKNIYFEQFIFLNLTILIRSFIIAVRYGYSSDARFQLMSISIQNLEYVSQDLLIRQWFILSNETIEKEIDSAFWRNQVEFKEFKFMIFEDIQDQEMKNRFLDPDLLRKDKRFDETKYQKQLQNYEKELKSKQKTIQSFDPLNQDYDMFTLHTNKIDPEKNSQIKEISDPFKMYDGRHILRELALFSRARSPNLIMLILVLTLVKMSIPFLIRLFLLGTPAGFDNWDSYVYQIFELLLLFSMTMPNYIFIFSGFIDFYRRLLMIKACSALINPFKSNTEPIYRMFPSINPCCKQSIHSWLMLRLCVMDFGRKFMNRIFLYCSTFFGAYLFFVIMLILNFFDILQLQLSELAQTLVLYDTLLVLTIVLIMLYCGAVINQQFINDRLQLIKIKQTLLFIKLNLPKVLKGEQYTSPYMKLFQKTLISYQQIMSQEDIKNLIEEIISEMDAINERLEIDGEHQPLKLLGLKATYGLMNSIYTSLLTIIVAVGQKMFSS
eukprot:403337362